MKRVSAATITYDEIQNKVMTLIIYFELLNK